STIVEETKISKPTVIKIISFFEEFGYVLTKKGDRSFSTRYFFPRELLYEDELTLEYAKRVVEEGADWVGYYNKFILPYRKSRIKTNKTNEIESSLPF
ncbi:MAG: hypothetical protein ACRDDY_01405, partial [Clostridium sp.]|uniref:hypothetical protein n=1 Tax=Clostridium sp. TaxID=1506 RepID=UPI003EE775FF